MTTSERERLLAMALWRITLLMALYAVALALTLRLGPRLPTTTIISLPLQLCFFAATVDFMRKSGLPRAAFGLVVGDAAVADVKGAVVVSAVVVVVAIALKALLLPGEPLWAPRDLWLWPLYPLSAFLQELVVRGGVQGILSRLIGPGRAVVVASTLFFVTHLHLSLPVALGSAPIGLLWGLLYAKQGRLLGVTVSHVLIGTVTFFLLGIPG